MADRYLSTEQRRDMAQTAARLAAEAARGVVGAKEISLGLMELLRRDRRLRIGR